MRHNQPTDQPTGSQMSRQGLCVPKEATLVKSLIIVNIFGICEPGASFVDLGPKILLTKHATFQKCPRKRPIPQKRFFWRGSDEKVLVPRALVLCPVDKNCSCRVIWSLVGCLVVGCGARAPLTIERLPTLYLYYKVYVYVHGRSNGSKNSMENLRGRGMYLGAPRTDV